jgi:hypothetical protein
LTVLSSSIATTRPGSHTVVTIDPLFDDGPDAMIDLARRFGRYRTYGEHEKIEIDIGRGLQQRHDSILNFLRTGGLRSATEAPAVLAARTSYFREEYAYGDREFVAGIAPFLHSDRLADAARAVHGTPVIVPAIAYANLMVPGQELAVHTDVPEFRGVNRKSLPQWLLVVMHHSGLFDDWRLRIATGIAWFHDSDHGALAYWPDGPDEPVSLHHIRANTALVLDTDTVFHGVDRVTDDAATTIPPVTSTTTLEPKGDRWALAEGNGTEVTTYDWDELRFSVSWKAYCFSDDAGRTSWLDHSDDLDETTVVETLVADLAEGGMVAADVPRDADLGLLLIDTYIGFPR